VTDAADLTVTGAKPNLNDLSNSFKLTGTALDNGAAASGDVVKVYDGSTYLSSTTLGSNGTWSFTTGTSNTIHTFTTTVTDPIGNTGQSTGAAIYGTNSNSMLMSTTGNDIMPGKGGADTFVFNGTSLGNDVTPEFWPHGTDVFEFSNQNVWGNADAATSHIAQ